MRELNSVMSILGEENVEELKRGITNILLEKLKDDLDAYAEYLLYPPDIMEIVNCTIEDTEKKIRKMYKDAVIEINQNYIDKMKTYMAKQFDEDKKLRHDVFQLAKGYYWRGNQYSKERRFAEDLMNILKVTEDDFVNED